MGFVLAIDDGDRVVALYIVNGNYVFDVSHFVSFVYDVFLTFQGLLLEYDQNFLYLYYRHKKVYVAAGLLQNLQTFTTSL